MGWEWSESRSRCSLSLTIVLSLPGYLTFGQIVEEALIMAEEAIEGFIACMIARGDEVHTET